MSPIGFLVNLETWNELPPDYQRIIIDTYKWVNEESVKYDLALIDTAMQAARDDKHVIINLTPEEIKTWADLEESYHEKWIKETEAKGWPAKAIYDEAKRLVAEYTK
jgi:TRAP-type C4-dicarboxylate transport system substrate-binding protein